MTSPEIFFLKYAFPCAHVLLKNKTINEERYGELEKSVRTRSIPTREIIEDSFPAAFRRIKSLAQKMGIEDYWDIRVLEEYWYNEHNKVIDMKEGNYSKFPESFRDFCKVHVAEIIKFLPEGFLLAKYEEKTRPVSGEYIQNPKIGEIVRIHHAYAVERVR